jgi:hypothetical protein
MFEGYEFSIIQPVIPHEFAKVSSPSWRVIGTFGAG